jgi:starch synthase (maltosyl-transferring)
MPPVPLGLVIGQLVHGGAERQLHALVRGLDRRLFQPIVFCLSEHTEPWGPRLEEAGAPVVSIPRRGHYDVLRILRLVREIRRRGIRVLHAFLLEATVYTALARTLAGAPVLITSNRVALPGRDGLRRAFDRWAFASSERVLVNSGAVRDFSVFTYGLRPDRIRVIYNGLDAGPYLAAARDESLRRELGAGPDDLLVGTVGRIAPQKAPDLFVEVAREVHDAEPRACFVWVGVGDLADSLRRAAAGAGLEGCLHLAGARSDIPRVLHALDLFLLTSRAEGLPNVVLEAMAAGRAVVATDPGGTGEALGGCGIVRPVDDAPGLARGVLDLLADAPRRTRMGAAGQARVQEVFSIPRMVEETQQLYLETLRERDISLPAR